MKSAERHDIFFFDDFRKYLIYCLEDHPKRTRPMSMAQWSHALGYSSARTLQMVLSASRLPSPLLLQKLIKNLRLSPEGARYLQLLVLREKSGMDKSLRVEVDDEIASLKSLHAPPAPSSRDIIEQFSTWYLFVVKQLVASKGFVDNPSWIVRQLRQKLNERQVEKAIETLVSIGILNRDKGGRLYLKEDAPIRSAHDIPHHAVRKHHREMLDRAKEAILEQDVLQREFNSLTLAVNPDRIGEMKQSMREFRERFCSTFEDKGGKHIAQLNLNFFFHTAPFENSNKDKRPS